MYSIINTLRITKNISINESEVLFLDLIECLQKKGKLFEAMTTGLFFRDMKDLMATEIITKYNLEVSFPFVGKKNPALPDFWKSLYNHLNNDENKKIRTAAIIGIGGKYDHWTVVRSISGTSMSLEDSFQLKKINRKYCTTHAQSGSRHHVLRPAQTFLLRAES